MALVFSRHRDERTVIDLREHGLGLIKVTVIDIRGDKVRLAFDADNDIAIHRQEVFDAIERTRQSAAQTSNPLGSQEGSKLAGGSEEGRRSA